MRLAVLLAALLATTSGCEVDCYGGGYSDGAASCSSARVGAPPPASDADPEDLKTCYARGYDQQIDRSALQRGLADGKHDNPDYQAGYRATFQPAYLRGETAGRR